MSKPNVISSQGVATTLSAVDGIEKKRYSDQELQEFKVLILKKLDAAREGYKMCRGSNFSENGTDDTSPTFKVIEDGASTYSNEINDYLAKRQSKFISQLEASLVRIENKTYGICRETGELISKERLIACPHTTSSIFVKRKN